jgi:hypothetical protein
MKTMELLLAAVRQTEVVLTVGSLAEVRTRMTRVEYVRLIHHSGVCLGKVCTPSRVSELLFGRTTIQNMMRHAGIMDLETYSKQVQTAMVIADHVVKDLKWLLAELQ